MSSFCHTGGETCAGAGRRIFCPSGLAGGLLGGGDGPAELGHGGDGVGTEAVAGGENAGREEVFSGLASGPGEGSGEDEDDQQSARAHGRLLFWDAEGILLRKGCSLD